MCDVPIFGEKIPILMSVVLNYAGEAGDGRRQPMIVSRLDEAGGAAYDRERPMSDV